MSTHTVPLTSNLSVHACACSQIRVCVCMYTRACTLVQCESNHLCIAEIDVNLSYSFSLALFSSFHLLHIVFILQLVYRTSFRVTIAIRECTACVHTRVRTRERLASAVKLLVSSTVLLLLLVMVTIFTCLPPQYGTSEDRPV